ncbi:Reverse transcriptase [Phytophthora palmivora]|uniref:Reverse transcriptase n=1 Tax=Phytophthora palmivora TaxID=4796 RepID=A0A2P4XDP9_9STRA|nr:Reverse transcriptase [Phytophthora palmivora]
MNNEVKTAIDRGVTDLVIVGDSRLAIQQSMGVIACKKETLQVDRVVLNAERKAELKTLNRIPEILYTSGDSTGDCEEGPKACPITRRQVRRVRFEEDEGKETNKPLLANEEDSTRPEATERDLDSELEIQRRQPASRIETSSEAEFGDTQLSSQGDEVELNTSRAPSADNIDSAVVQAERRRRIDRAQDEELRWADLKAYLRGELSQLSFRRVRNAGKVADDFVLSEDGLLYRHNRSRRRDGDDEPSLNLRLVVPTTMVDEVLQNCHNSVEGGHQGFVRTYHRVKSDYYWIGLYVDVVRHVQSYADCCTSKSKPHLRGYSPGNIVSARRFHIVSMDFVIPLPRTRRGNAALLLFQDHFTGFVIMKAMAETGALEVAKVFEENVFRIFGAPSLSPRFMSEVFQKFSEMIQSRSRATLRYRPQANGQQEPSVKTMIQTVRVYVEDPSQADWDDSRDDGLRNK